MGKQPVTPSAPCPISQAFNPPPVSPGQPGNDVGREITLAQSPASVCSSLQTKWFGVPEGTPQKFSYSVSVRPACPYFFIFIGQGATTIDQVICTVNFINGGVIVSQVKVYIGPATGGALFPGYIGPVLNNTANMAVVDPNTTTLTMKAANVIGNQSFKWTAQCDTIRFDCECFQTLIPSAPNGFFLGVQQSDFRF
jgi:hypothetical protein